MIPFNKPYYSSNEISAISSAMESKVLTGDNFHTNSCESFLEKKYGFPKVFLTTSCTSALEMAAMLMDIKEGDEVIMPSFTYVSTANAFALRGAKIIFIDSKENHPQMDENKIEAQITKRTKAIVVVHYAGVACNMDFIGKLAATHKLKIIEDAAQCIGASYKGKPLGSIGDVSCFSFHETKNVHCGEGGFIVMNDVSLIPHAEILKNKGTNRSSFIRGEINKYEWMGLGFSATPSALTSAFLYAQLNSINVVMEQRKKLWDEYYRRLSGLIDSGIQLPIIPSDSSHNAHIFYLVCRNEEERSQLILFLKTKEIQAVFHYQSLHSSPYFKKQYSGPVLVNADLYSSCLVRLPLFYDLTFKQIKYISNMVIEFYNK